MQEFSLSREMAGQVMCSACTCILCCFLCPHCVVCAVQLHVFVCGACVLAHINGATWSIVTVYKCVCV